MRIKKRFILPIILSLSFIAACDTAQKPPEEFKKYSSLNPSGDFELQDQNGAAFHLKDQRGKVVLLFFGYLACPDICPTMLAKITRVYKLLGADKDKVLTVFITIDPERDTPQKLKEYLEYFNVKSAGLTGTKEQVDKVVEAYGASYEKVYTQGKDYLMNHSDYLYLIDKDGKVCQLFHPEGNAEMIVNFIKREILK